MTYGVTIGQAAAFAGITVKTIRHYHRRGLVAEPRRDASGYRRYETAELLRLVQVRTLAEAGVPLAEIGPILDSGADEFAVALADVERRLTDRITELTSRRDTLHRLATGDRVLLPDRALALLDGAAALGFATDDLTMIREALVLFRALVPEGFDDYLAQIEQALEHPRYLALIKRMWRCGDWAPDDPRVDELAAAIADYLVAHPSLLPIPAGIQARTDGETRYAMLKHYGEEQKPVWARLTVLIETRLRSAGIEIPYQQGTGGAGSSILGVADE
ncbi:MerR family transcriptional regulator [Prauserella marina]|uniref:DNA-binding transcriptional regulator, MerR family n=1 Tax=Prauserella marina TaxID=530584 RepID=A0A222VUI3_9PSEU|nr:MerR family transcriptional regulator [Prauserella marina]ASR37589.1 MerR family transcriptional regulator [Prauserella marina]PWV75496.1 MerR family transcriptional regulator [Prauserella marina]SDD33245.1 DNA-binding transcriptional regulator, MerR family [Prauserella marina]